ncbi:MAG: hypothetical protein ABR913_02030 [Sedimentisphaerales bacterium]|jgi:hypothetical protein
MAKHLPISFIWVTKMDSRQISKIRNTTRSGAQGPLRKYEIRNGSAIILAIVLTTLLAILGVLFLLSSRVDSVATSAVGDNQDLKLAVDTVVAQISEVLIRNVPGVDPNGTYYNYPDGNNPWLASLEPNYLGVWPHVTDLYYPQLGLSAYNLVADVNYEHSDHAANGIQADADGDGASDSMWVQIPGKMSAKGKPIYAAIRIIDNGGMLNVNTGYQFAPNHSVGSTQLDINLMALSWRPNTSPYDPNAENTLRLMRDPSGLANYENNVIWQYGLPNGAYTPFDISDELEMRYRFVIDQKNIHTRLESWGNQFSNLLHPSVLWTPFDDDDRPSNVPKNWITHTYDSGSLDPNYSYRHIATTYNMDRIINSAGHKMLNINNPNITAGDVCDVVKTALLETGTPDADWLAAQIAVNLIDSLDTDSNVTTLVDANGQTHYGFETPCIYISQIAQSFFKDPCTTGRSYAIELYKPYASDPFPDSNNKWQLVINRDPCNPIPVYWPANSPFFVIANRDVNAAPLDINHVDANDVNDLRVVFDGGDTILLQRAIDTNGTSPFFSVDWVSIPALDPCTGWLVESNDIAKSTHSIKRDITLHKCIRRLWEDPRAGFLLPPALGSFSYRYIYPDSFTIQAHPQNGKFTNIGEIGQLFRTDAYLTGPNDTEASVRLNIADRNFQNIFKYLTVMDPNTYTGDPNETRIKGRININTAPWFVLAQLPWVSYHTQPNYNLAQSIVNYRDTIHGPFKSIGELMTDANSSINSIGYYEGETMPIPTALLTPPDGVGDAFEERDVIFDRISNLITVRSDVFTAYILVRIGTDGPQKRVVAIFDRSGVTPTSGKVKIVAIQQVPDPR